MTNDDPTDQVLSVIHAVYDNWAAGDADAFAELYTEDATVVQPGVHKKNKGEIRTTMAAGFAGPLKGSRVLDEPQSVRFLGRHRRGHNRRRCPHGRSSRTSGRTPGPSYLGSRQTGRAVVRRRLPKQPGKLIRPWAFSSNRRRGIRLVQR